MNTNKSTPPAVQPTCSSSVKDDEFKNLSGDVGTKQHGDYCKNKDKSLDTQSLKDTTEKDSCVCCNVAKIDESKELELNAFHLLETHLREKLEEFKLSNCKSCCIPPKEEEKLFSAILQRVKQIITDSTSVIACKCAPKIPAEGSWHRAYMLLQEYLKIKIKRVQCLCLSTEDDKQAVLPNVMEKVCTLIDNDFQRLKAICKCRIKTDGLDQSPNTECPEKDNCRTLEDQIDTAADLQNTEKINKEVSNRSLILTQNISSQSPNIEMETKSCDIIEMFNENNGPHKTNTCCGVTKFNNCFCVESSRVGKSYVEFGTQEVLVNQCINVLQEVKEVSLPTDLKTVQYSDQEKRHVISNNELHSVLSPELDKKPDVRKSTPYIGYTVDCSCNGVLGTCTCTKSIISGKNDNINSIWNTLTSNKLRYSDISYIMDAVPYKGLNEVNDLKNTHHPIIPQPITKLTCDTKVSAQDCEGVILKDSKMKLNKTFLSTTTSGTDVSFGQDLNSEEPIDWCDCSSSMKQKTQKINNISDNTGVDSLYYPLRNVMNQDKNESLVKSDPVGSLSSNCDCNMVPMCHVKMLVENIENKLMHSKCTCDSLCSKICPVHSKKL
ncbi:uncharacterized protein LOC135082195 [Ostrinia nubilalis]|uniref:uncharacterized protein LOC135082195 n=1 Tax=Ostrinia nubilalis TaxID=29057 RepID=UPI0030825935